MNIQREWRLIFNVHGWLPFAIYFLLVLAGAVVLVMLFDEHQRLSTDLDKKQASIPDAKAKKELLTKVELTQSEVHTNYTGISSRLINSNDDPALAGERLVTALKTWYSGLGVRDAAVITAGLREDAGIFYISGTVDAPMRIEQFAALLQNKVSAPLALRLVDMDIQANDPVTPSGLRTRITWEGIRAPVTNPIVVKANEGDGKKSIQKSSVRTVNRGESRPDTLQFNDEKRK